MMRLLNPAEIQCCQGSATLYENVSFVVEMTILGGFFGLFIAPITSSGAIVVCAISTSIYASAIALDYVTISLPSD